MLTRHFRLAAALMALGVLPNVAAAQGASDMSVGYSHLTLDPYTSDREFMPLGWNVSFAGGLARNVSVIADFSGNYHSERNDTFSLHTLQGGVRFTALRGRAVQPFGQFVTGAVVAWEDEAITKFMYQPGGGVDFRFRDKGPGMRAQVDFPFYVVEGATYKAIRASVGVIIPFK